MIIRIVSRRLGTVYCETNHGPEVYVVRVMRQALLGEETPVFDGSGCEYIRPYMGEGSPLVFASCFERSRSGGAFWKKEEQWMH